MQALAPDDAVVATYREHGHALARGVAAGADHGGDVRQARGLQPRPRRLDAHLRRGDAASTAATRSSAAGCRSPSASRSPTRCSGAPRVTACFFGEGAVAEGEFHESLNLAALWSLPVLFCCENNLYAMGTALARSESRDRSLREGRELRDRRPWPVDGMDVLRGRGRGAARGRRGARGGGPHFLELRTYRFRAHSMFDPELYREQGRGRGVEAARSDRAFAARARAQAALLRRALARARGGGRGRVARAVAFAEAGHFEPVEELRASCTSRAGAVTRAARRGTITLPRGDARRRCARRCSATSASS